VCGARPPSRQRSRFNLSAKAAAGSRHADPLFATLVSAAMASLKVATAERHALFALGALAPGRIQQKWTPILRPNAPQL
jgi:hypothetical protein